VTTPTTPTTTTLFSVPTPSFPGQPVTFIAIVTPTPPATGTPTGTVTFNITGPSPTSGTVPLVGGLAFFTTTLPTAGTYTATATYNGDATFSPSTSSPVTQTVSTAPTITTLTSSPNPSNVGQQVTFTATVIPLLGTGTPTGTVTYLVDGVPQATLPVGTPFQTSSLTPGVHVVIAQYSGDTNFNGSTSNPVIQVVQGTASTTTTLTSSPNPSTPGQAVTFTATVTPVPPATGTPTGTVTFNITGPSGTITQTVPLPAGSNQASFTTTGLTVAGTYTATATYNGDTNFGPSTSTPLTHTVSGGTGTNTTLNASPAVIRLNPTTGQFFIPTLSATLTNTSTAAGISGQTITFTASPVTGNVNLGSAVTDSNGVATLTNVPVSPTLITATQYTASFAGGGGFNPSTDTAPLTFQPV
jgi:hypothetical protein